MCADLGAGTRVLHADGGVYERGFGMKVLPSSQCQKIRRCDDYKPVFCIAS